MLDLRSYYFVAARSKGSQHFRSMAALSLIAAIMVAAALEALMGTLGSKSEVKPHFLLAVMCPSQTTSREGLFGVGRRRTRAPRLGVTVPIALKAQRRCVEHTKLCSAPPPKRCDGTEPAANENTTESQTLPPAFCCILCADAERQSIRGARSPAASCFTR